MGWLIIEIPGRPRPQYRHMHSKWGGGYDHPKNRENKAYLKAEFLKIKEVTESKRPYFGDAPVEMQIHCQFARPKAMKNDPDEHIAHTKRPDLSNIQKLIEDMGNGFLWKDDSQIYRTHTSKYYAPYGADYAPRTLIVLKERDSAIKTTHHSESDLYIDKRVSEHLYGDNQ